MTTFGIAYLHSSLIALATPFVFCLAASAAAALLSFQKVGTKRLQIALILIWGIIGLSGCATKITGQKLQELVWETTPIHSAYNDFFYAGSDPHGHHFRHIRMLAIDSSYRVTLSDPLVIADSFAKTNDRSEWQHLSEPDRWRKFFLADYPLLYQIKQRIPDQTIFWFSQFKTSKIKFLGINQSQTESAVQELVSITYTDGNIENVTITYRVDRASITWHKGSDRTRRQADKKLRAIIRKAGFQVRH